MKKNIRNSLLIGVFTSITLSSFLYSISKEEGLLRSNAQKYLIDSEIAQMNFNAWTQLLETVLKTVDVKNNVSGSFDSTIKDMRTNVKLYNSMIERQLMEILSSNNGNLRLAIHNLYLFDKTLQNQRQDLLALKSLPSSRKDAVNILIAGYDVLRKFIARLITEAEKKIGIYKKW